ncbi:Cytosolic_carboxypeptidase 6 [Hexamita inflata]|uniref:Cytosolic carboxypeptidase 6 n=1 Tax=Hexamita inflata TaxID=28002 RepID=A0AA86QRR6_9EUKA|nr:Cytosolic carboxypeptidase 6 [Hexamita inflata]
MNWLYQSPSIAFDANFESGNLASAERVNEFEYDLFIQPDISTTTRMWFYFRCQSVPLNQPILFNIVGINKSNTTFSTQQRIIVRSTSRSKWQRLPSTQQFYTNSSKHRCYSSFPILSFSFQFEVQEEYFFAFGYPYTYSMLQKFIARIADHSLPFVSIDSLGKSSQDRDMTCITIGRPSVFSKYYNDKRPETMHTVMITARTHAGEFPGSYICHGILEFMLSNNPKAKFLRNNVQFKIVPMVNPDGVFSGYYRTNSNGYDLNRNFYEPVNQTQEATIIKGLAEELMGTERSETVGSFDQSTLNSVLLDIATQEQIGLTEASQDEDSSQSQSKPQSASGNYKSPLNKEKSKSERLSAVPANIPKIPVKATKLSYDQMIEQEHAKAGLNTQPPHKTHLDFVIDLHSHSNQSGGFLFLNPDGYIFQRAKRQRTEQVFPQILAKNCSVFGSLQSSFKESQNVREGSLRRAFCQLGKQKLADDCPYIYCLEISNSHGPDPAEGGKAQLKVEEDAESSDADQDMEEEIPDQKFVIYTPEKYMQIGEKICDSLYDIYSKLFK